MRISKLELRNFRCFQHAEITFPATGSSVLIGINGVGKTSVLDALSVFMNSLFSAFHKRKGSFVSLNLSDQNRNADERMSIVFQAEILGKEYKQNTYVSVSDHIISAPSRDLAEEITFRDSNSGVPVMMHFRESFGLKAFHEVPIKGARGQSFLEWFQIVETYENEQKIVLKDFSHEDKRLHAIRIAVKTFFGQFSDDKFGGLRVDRSDLLPKGELVIEKNGLELPVRFLSSGEKSVLGLIATLSAELSVSYSVDQDPLKGQGIVLIDEIDQHLHPKWQREILGCLEKTFPNIQFIVSTHSPQVISDCPIGHVFAINEGEIESLPYSYGRDSNWILEQIMDTHDRPKAIDHLIERYFDAIKNGDIDEVYKIRQELKVKMGGDNDPVFARGDVLTRMKQKRKGAKDK